MKKQIIIFLTICLLLIFVLSGCSGSSGGSSSSKTTFTLILPDTYTASDKTSTKTIPAGKPILIVAINEENFDDNAGKYQVDLELTGVTKSGGTTLDWLIEDKYIVKEYIIGAFIILDTVKYDNLEFDYLVSQKINEEDKVIKGLVRPEDQENDATILTPGGRTITFECEDCYYKPDEE
jgi:hypothetical protein